MSDIIKIAAMDLAKSGLGVVAAKAVDIPKRLEMGDSFPLVHASNGAINFLVSDGINYIDGMGSKLLNMNVYSILDDVLFFGGVSALVEVSTFNDVVYDTLRSSMQLNRDTTELAVQAGVLSLSRFGARYIDENQSLPDAVKIFRHPVSTLVKRA